MANNRRIRVDIEGDSSSLQRALNTGSEAIEGFGKKAGGTIGEFADVLGGD
jgi:microcompartment protein CcmL/EutN